MTDTPDVAGSTARYTALGGASGVKAPPLDLVCLSHLRWHSVFQRPHHLMTRCAREHRVFFVEEPVEAESDRLIEERTLEGIQVITPGLSPLDEGDREERIAALLQSAFAEHGIREYLLWYYTPMALGFTRQLAPAGVVFDCMDELSAFAGAPRNLLQREAELLDRADLVLTGGQSLYEAKRHRHHNIHPFPSSVDVPHFAKARKMAAEPDDQASIPRPRLGFFGVLDERLDLELLAGVAAARPDWHLVLIGPVVKVDRSRLPTAPNIHYLGPKHYAELPSYLAGWDVALVPFARNEATRFISPTKTPEYMAAGCPVVSTSIRDIVRPYGELGLVRIADEVGAFVEAVAETMTEEAEPRRRKADEFLARMSWDDTWSRMSALMRDAIERRRAADVTGERVAGAASSERPDALIDIRVVVEVRPVGPDAA